MRLNNRILRFQEGGPMPADPAAMGPEAMGPEGGMPMGPEGGAPMGPEGGPQGGPNPAELEQLAQQIIQGMGPEAAAMLAEILLQMVQGGGGQQPPLPPEGAQPAFQRRGGRLVRIR